jgi:predicted DNA-binding transcriptional regulator YafY
MSVAPEFSAKGHRSFAMRRADRLFDLIQTLRDGRLHRASELAQLSRVSVRTIWRDMATLMASGLPIEGERGVGYVLRAPVALPPMILTAQELEALRAGIRLIAESRDETLSRAARNLAAKIGGMMPKSNPGQTDALFEQITPKTKAATPHIPVLRKAIRLRQRITLTYIDPQNIERHRDIRPLALDLKTSIWTLIAWCEGRSAFHSFRLSKVIDVAETGEIFGKDRDKSLRAYHAFANQTPVTNQTVTTNQKTATNQKTTTNQKTALPEKQSSDPV